jgi:hypothetical protein
MRRRVVLLLLPAAVLVAGVNLISSDAGSINLALSLPRPTAGLTAAHGSSYVTLSLPDAGTSSEPGTPQLPVIRRLVEIPYGAVVTAHAADISTGRLALPGPLLPVQPPIPKSGPAPDFAYDAPSYAGADLSPADWVRIAGTAEVRNHRVALVEIYPVHYSPATGTVEYLTSAEIRLVLSGSDLAETQQRYREYYSPAFEGVLQGLVMNFEAYAADPPPTLPVGYLIIVPDSWYNTVLTLAQWRRQKGLDVTMTRLSQIGGGSSTQVLAYIQNAYNNWPVKPSYVLLVGDIDSISYFRGQGDGHPNTDLNYSLLAGSDYLPDVCVSRASVADIAQLDSFVQKTVKYEQNQWLNGTDWTRKAFFIASADPDYHGEAEQTQRYCMDKLRGLGVACDSQYLYYQNARQPTIDRINEGRAWVAYSGHGDVTEWAEHSPVFDNNATHALANLDKVPFVASFCCLSGDFARTECFSESWIRSGFRGGIAHLASSVESYWTEDDTFQRRVFDCLFDSSYTWVMSAINRAKIWYYAQMGNTPTTRRYFEMYNLMGDGEVDVYSDVPHALTVDYPTVIPLGAYNLHVTVEYAGAPVRNALVCAEGKNDTTIHSSAWTDSSGAVDLPVQTSAPDSVLITVTGHNLAPYFGAALARPGPGAFVTFLKCFVDDSPPGGNGDGIINPGETINLPTWVKNWGQGPGDTVVGVLRSTDSAVTVQDSLRSFGTVSAGDSAFTGDSGFRFHVADTCSNGHPIALSLVCRDDRDSTWTSRIDLSPVAGVLEPAASHGLESSSLVAFPVPASGATRVLWQTGTKGPARVRILDISGREVRAFSEIRDSPRFLTWDGTDDQGRRVPAGIYFCRVILAGKSLDRKLVLLR